MIKLRSQSEKSADESKKSVPVAVPLDNLRLLAQLGHAYDYERTSFLTRTLFYHKLDGV